jgi:hypothetical protein
MINESTPIPCESKYSIKTSSLTRERDSPPTADASPYSSARNRSLTTIHFYIINIHNLINK